MPLDYSGTGEETGDREVFLFWQKKARWSQLAAVGAILLGCMTRVGREESDASRRGWWRWHRWSMVLVGLALGISRACRQPPRRGA